MRHGGAIMVLAILVTLVPVHHLTIFEVTSYPKAVSSELKKFTGGAISVICEFTDWSRYKLTAETWPDSRTKTKYIYIYMYVSMYVCMYVCVYVYMYI